MRRAHRSRLSVDRMSNLIDRGFQSWTRALEREPQTGEVTVVDPDSGGQYVCRLQSLTSDDVKKIGSLAWTDRLENVGPFLLVGGLVTDRFRCFDSDTIMETTVDTPIERFGQFAPLPIVISTSE